MTVPAVLVLVGWVALVAGFASSRQGDQLSLRGPVFTLSVLALMVGSVWLAVSAL